jgi:hypothetical protein
MRPTESTLKRLFARSGNGCPFPHCKAALTHNDTLIGEVCHIKGEKPGAARYDVSQTDQERQAYDNLIAMCPTHHTVIDDDPESYTVERIIRMKTQHEQKTAAMPDTDASQVASIYLTSNFSNFGQTGGIAAQNFHAQTLNVNNNAPADPILQKRQLQAIETLWKAVRALKHEFGQLFYVDNIFTSEEIHGFFKSGWPRSVAHMREYAGHHVIVEKYDRALAMESDHEKPFVSQRVWAVYYIIRALHGRIAYLFEQSFKESAYRDWRRDSGADQLMRSVLPSQVVEAAKSLNIGGLANVFDHLEEQFMAEANMRGVPR